ncbi:MAG: ugpB [Microvirga sp.]|jgi:multiple sugar transport system substrate-binding protein|nr:ugpB [Geminicoccaceae bacterium]MDF2970897.1 ugpB [Microvirga sp.]
MQRLSTALFAAALSLAPLGVRAADLVVWWQEGYYDQEDEAVREIVAAFEQGSGKRVELAQPTERELPNKIVAALKTGQPPDFAFGVLLQDYIGRWAVDGRLADLSTVVGAFSNLFDPDALAWVTWRSPRTGQGALYGLPIGRELNHVHVWKSLLQEAGFTLADIPREWVAFWSFWCDQVQPAVRRATGREDIWGVALPMSVPAGDTDLQFFQFVAAYDANYVSGDGRLLIDDPQIRQRLVKAIDGYTAIYRKGCTPPNSVTWDSGLGNNEAFWSQQAVMVPNVSLSIPNALKRERPEDYYKNTATIEWPLGPSGEPFPIVGTVVSAVVFKTGNSTAAEEFVRFLVAEGWLAHPGERFLPPMTALSEQPFWLDPSDPHRMASAMQAEARPLAQNHAAASGKWRHQLVNQEFVWATAIHRVVTEGITPEQAVDEAILRIRQILSE